MQFVFLAYFLFLSKQPVKRCSGFSARATKAAAGFDSRSGHTESSLVARSQYSSGDGRRRPLVTLQREYKGSIIKLNCRDISIPESSL